jgi:two-component system chemotaxis response regulator CheY
LIVEDSPLVRKMYGLVFSPREHELDTAEDGRKGLEALTVTSQRYDLILLDLRMPDMDGVEFIRAVKRTAAFASIPIVLTTVEADTSDLLLQARVLGVAAVVKKPWKPQDLRNVVQSVLHGPRV